MQHPKRIAVIVPIGYRGGSLRGAKLLAEALWYGSRQAGEPAEIVLGHLNDSELYAETEFADFPSYISRRSYEWRALSNAEARRALHYAHKNPDELTEPLYHVPDDFLYQFTDCDLWVIISDRVQKPLLPIKPYVCMVYDYIQRYMPIIDAGTDQPYLDLARNAKAVLVTTRFTEKDALQYAGVAPERVKFVPMLTPDFKNLDFPQTVSSNYFLWTTNASKHKNHANAALALREYYEALGGRLKCHVTGVGTGNLLHNTRSHLTPLAQLFKHSDALQENVVWKGDLPDVLYRSELANAAFLWHAGRIDNGTFSVVEAAYLGVPSLSSDYPAMHEINAQFNLNMHWMNADSPKDMALQLKHMEDHITEQRSMLPSVETLQSQNLSHLALHYWKVIRECV